MRNNEERNVERERRNTRKQNLKKLKYMIYVSVKDTIILTVCFVWV